MNLVLCVAQGLLALAFLTAGLTKVSRPKDRLRELLPYTEDLSQGAVHAIGTAEILGAVAVVLPAALKIAPVLTPLAATGLALLMVGAAVVHLRREEPSAILVNGVLFLLAVRVAWGRFGPYHR